MNDALIVTIYVVIDETMKTLGHQSHSLAALSDAEVLTVAVVAAHAFGNHQRRALDMLYYRGYLTTRLSPSRFNRRLHALAAWLSLLVHTVGTFFYRTDLVAPNEVPKTLDELVKVSERLQKYWTIPGNCTN